MKKLGVKNWLDEMGFECIEDTQYSHAYKRETQMVGIHYSTVTLFARFLG